MRLKVYLCLVTLWASARQCQECQGIGIKFEQINEDPEVVNALNRLQKLEAQWLSQKSEREALRQRLEASGWSLESTNWQESSTLRLDQSLMNRWLGEGRPYRLAVEGQTSGHSSALVTLRNELMKCHGQQLPMRLKHWRINGRRR